LQAKFADKIKIHILFSAAFFNNHVVYEIMWKNTVEADRRNIAHAQAMPDTQS
jgi:hypothetical protein